MPKLSAAWPDKKLTMPILKVSWARALWVSKANTEAVRARRAKVVIMVVFSKGNKVDYSRNATAYLMRYTLKTLVT
jgi:hypothetical protein